MSITADFIRRVDVIALEQKVKAMYRDVALDPHGEFHFEMGRALAERLGYVPADLDAIPSEAIDSFAGVGHYFDLAALKPGETVVDLGSGSGTDSFIAALKVGRTGSVIGIDMTDEQLAKSERLRAAAGFENVTYLKGYIGSTGLLNATCDAAISNGVINLAPDKHAVFREAARILKPGGRLALADIVTETQLPQGITCDATLWAACIGGAMQVDDYVAAIESAGLHVREVKNNPQYQFISDNAQGATRKYGVKSVSILAIKA
jgi:ubiquinone/menaquinone biosynthesis C-methylase UbiE